MARAPVEEVTVTIEPDSGNDTVEVHSHPAFHQISITRSQGGHGHLYGSDFDHHARMTLRIAPSQLRRRVGTDWFMPAPRDILELDMSESQWATLISSPNMGSGVPCTLTRFGNDMIPAVPAPKARTTQFGEEMVSIIQDSLDRIAGINAIIDGMNLPKGKSEKLKFELRVAADLLKGNTPYIARRFDEHMEETVEKAKTEVNGYMTGAVIQAGLDHLASLAPPVSLALEGPDKEHG